MTKKIKNKSTNRSIEHTLLHKKILWYDNPIIQKLYAAIAVLTLLFSTIFWSTLGANIHATNADQLINPYLFKNLRTFHSALIPGQHSYLLKWPIFLLVHILGATSNVYIVFTVLVSVLTVGLLAFLLWNIDKRPLIFGTILLLLSSVLLQIPAQPYAGGVLPVNMAMVATRNLEYVLFIACLMAAIRARFKSSGFIVAVIGMAVIVASDKLFLNITLIGSVMAMVVYAKYKQRENFKLAKKWMALAVLGGASGILILRGINLLDITNISSQGTGPFGLVSSIHQITLGVFYAFFGLLTNIGANPAFSTTYVGQILRESISHILSWGGPALVLNFIIFIIGLKAIILIFKTSLGYNKLDTVCKDKYYGLSLALIWATIGTFVGFIFTDHYYAADSRYLGLSLFTLFISLSTYSRSKNWPNKRLLMLGAISLIFMLLSLPDIFNYYRQEKQALQPTNLRNIQVVHALSSHRVDYLVGDYWRVVPIKSLSSDEIKVTPLGDCSKPRDVLSSLSWRPDLRKTSFAYLLTIDKSLTDFPQCSLSFITNIYGKPNSSVLIAGSLDNPKELLLFYDHGANQNANSSIDKQTSATITPINLSELRNSFCPDSSIVNIVAHEDDDILFINPDTQEAISNGSCVRTIYITAGDSGFSKYYWLGREQGSEAAYSNMIGFDTLWTQRIVKIGENRFITIANPRGNSKISLLYMHLPDGNLFGDGFKASQYQSLRKLTNHSINNIDTVYGQSSYTLESLTSTLVDILKLYKPTEIRTLDYTNRDHSDHIAVSRLAEQAYNSYTIGAQSPTVSIKHYLGYSISSKDQNVFGDDLSKKSATFFKYASHDEGVCKSMEECDNGTTYGSYLRRQYNAL